jgi:hypothetical protein
MSSVSLLYFPGFPHFPSPRLRYVDPAVVSFPWPHVSSGLAVYERIHFALCSSTSRLFMYARWGEKKTRHEVALFNTTAVVLFASQTFRDRPAWLARATTQSSLHLARCPAGWKARIFKAYQQCSTRCCLHVCAAAQPSCCAGKSWWIASRREGRGSHEAR